MEPENHQRPLNRISRKSRWYTGDHWRRRRLRSRTGRYQDRTTCKRSSTPGQLRDLISLPAGRPAENSTGLFYGGYYYSGLYYSAAAARFGTGQQHGQIAVYTGPGRRIDDHFPCERRLLLGDQQFLRTGNADYAESVFRGHPLDGIGYTGHRLYFITVPAVVYK